MLEVGDIKKSLFPNTSSGFEFVISKSQGEYPTTSTNEAWLHVMIIDTDIDYIFNSLHNRLKNYDRMFIG